MFRKEGPRLQEAGPSRGAPQVSVAHVGGAARVQRAGLPQRISLKVAGLDAKEASFAKRGFPGGSPERQQRLEGIGETFLQGYNCALAAPDVQSVVNAIRAFSAPLRGFFAEGAAMGVAVSDALPWTGSPRLAEFLANTSEHEYLTHVGVGWAMARMPWRRAELARTALPLLVPLAIDGRGFHDVYFAPRRFATGMKSPSAAQRQSWDQGAGRAVWFISGGDVSCTLAHIDAVDPARRDDLYAGLGLALTYAGGASEPELLTIRQHAGKHADHLAQGAAFASEARQRAHTVTPECERACQLLTGLALERVVAIVRRLRPEHGQPHQTPPLEQSSEPAPSPYESWRRAVRTTLSSAASSGD